MTSPTVPTPPHYGGLYGGLAFVMMALTGGHLYATIEDDGYIRSFLTLWEMLGTRYGGGLGLLALTLVGVLALLCAIAVVRPRTPVGVPIAVAVLGLGGAVMLILRVGTEHHPPLAAAGAMMLITCWAAVVLGIVHTIHLLVWRSQHRVSG